MLYIMLYNIVYNILHRILLHVTYLGIFFPETMSVQIKGVAPGLRPSSEILALPHKCGECSQMGPITVRHKVLR